MVRKVIGPRGGVLGHWVAPELMAESRIWSWCAATRSAVSFKDLSPETRPPPTPSRRLRPWASAAPLRETRPRTVAVGPTVAPDRVSRRRANRVISIRLSGRCQYQAQTLLAQRAPGEFRVLDRRWP